jgi:AcrR family transcriptional regulator
MVPSARSAAKPRRNTPKRKQEILAGAASVFASHGYEAATLRMVEEVSGAAIGSLVHHYGDKAGLAHAVYGAAADSLVEVVKGALSRTSLDVPSAIGALLAACDAWTQRDKQSCRLLRLLAPSAIPALTACKPVEHQLAAVLSVWVSDHPQRDRMRKLSHAELYALVLAPVRSFRIDHGAGAGVAKRLEPLVDAALAGLLTPDAGLRKHGMVRPMAKKQARPEDDEDWRLL